MKPTNGKASTIFIRDLSKKDNTALKEVREDFRTEFNTVAVMKSVYTYLEQKKTIAEQRTEIDGLQRKVEELTGQIDQIKDSIKEYFAFQVEKENRQRDLSAVLAAFAQEPKKPQGKKAPGAKAKRSTGRSGLAAILKQ